MIRLRPIQQHHCSLGVLDFQRKESVCVVTTPSLPGSLLSRASADGAPRGSLERAAEEGLFAVVLRPPVHVVALAAFNQNAM
jgi:hypothetical protein